MKPSTLRCLQLLRTCESVTTHDFLVGGCGSRFGARLAELRHEYGCVIDEHKLSDRSGSRYRLLAEPETSGAASPLQDPHREGDAALKIAAASTQARGSGSTGTDRRRERNGTFEAARRPEPLTGQCLVDNAATNRAIVPANDAAPSAGSRTAEALFDPEPFTRRGMYSEAA